MTPRDRQEKVKSPRRSPAVTCHDDTEQVSAGAQMWLSIQTLSKQNISLTQHAIDLSLTRLLDNTTINVTGLVNGKGEKNFIILFLQDTKTAMCTYTRSVMMCCFVVIYCFRCAQPFVEQVKL